MLPVCAMKVIDNAFVWDKPVKVRVFDVSHALQARVVFDHEDMRANKVVLTMYVSNLNCHEFSKMRIHKSVKESVSKKSERNGVSYLRPTRYSVRLNRRASDYVKDLFKQYPNDISVVVHGYGILNNIVGEFYVNGVSLSQHLIEKGYCSYVN